MIKSQLIAKLATKMTHLSEKQVADSINHILNRLSEALIENRRIEIRGFGAFWLHLRPSRVAHNPKTGKKVLTESKHRPRFKPGKALKERVNASRFSVPLVDKKEGKR